MSTPEQAEPDFPPTTVMEAVEPQADAPQSAVIAEALSRIEDKLAESQRLIDRQAEIAAKLHAENQVLRTGELRKAQGSLVLGVLRVFDDVSRMAATTQDPAGRDDLTIVADALADALARNGVDALAVDVGEPFEARKHKIAAIEPTLDPAADRTVASVVRTGFAWSDGEPVRVTDVAVFKYTAAPEREPEPATEPELATEPEPPAA